MRVNCSFCGERLVAGPCRPTRGLKRTPDGARLGPTPFAVAVLRRLIEADLRCAIVYLQIEIGIPAGMPECDHLNTLGFGLDSIVEKVPHATQVKATHSRELHVSRDRSYVWLSTNEFECLFDGITKGIGCGGAVFVPPFRG